MGQCLRGKMTEAGLIPAPATALAEPAALVEEPVAATPAPMTEPAPATDIGEPALDVAPAAEVPDNLTAATFGLLRAEPDGSAVIAGSGTPGTEVEVYANDSLLGKATVETSGDWVLVPDAPIPPGGAEITLGEAGKPGRAEQSFVVAINQDKSSEPLVVTSTPGAASAVLQGLDRPASETTSQLAAADPVMPTPELTTPDEPAVPAESAVPAQSPAATPSQEPATPTATAAATAVAAPSAPAEEPIVTAEAAPATQAAPAIVSPTPSATPAEPAATAADPVPTAVPEATVAAVEPPATTAAAPAIVRDGTPPTIDAIELDGERTFFAGSGPDGATLRLYVDDVFIADTKVTAGRWLLEAGKVLNRPSQRVRIDVLRTDDSAEVASRAEVNFVIELPVEEEPVAVAQAEEPVQPVPEPVAAAAEPMAAPDPAAADPAPAAPASVGESAPTPAPAAVADALPTMVAVSVGDPETQRFASGKAIIRRGDNLWTIARRVYGEGVKYTTIYQANTGQIRDPDRIYPGQVFELPQGATN